MSPEQERNLNELERETVPRILELALSTEPDYLEACHANRDPALPAMSVDECLRGLLGLVEVARPDALHSKLGVKP